IGGVGSGAAKARPEGAQAGSLVDACGDEIRLSVSRGSAKPVMLRKRAGDRLRAQTHASLPFDPERAHRVPIVLIELDTIHPPQGATELGEGLGSLARHEL